MFSAREIPSTFYIITGLMAFILFLVKPAFAQTPIPNGCYAIKAPHYTNDWPNYNGYLSHGGPALLAYHADRAKADVWEKFYFSNRAANNYLIYGEDGKFLSPQPSGAVFKYHIPGGWEEWEIHKLDANMYGIRSVAHNRWLSSDRTLLGVVTTKTARDRWETWYLEPTTGCKMLPEAEINANVTVQPGSGGPLFGIADTHGHTFTQEGFGGLAFQGETFHRHGLLAAMPWCDKAHGPGGVGDIIGNVVDGTVGHKVGGFPQFDGWPRWNSSVHQQMYYKWIERAYLGGLRLQTMLAVNNEVLCKRANQKPGYGCDDMPSVDRQIEKTKALEAFIDAEHGGPGKGWFRIAYSARQARDIINSGKMAVVLGIEVDALFGCKVGQCDEAFVVKELDRYYDMGVRHIFPVHVFDNAFGGASLYNPLFNLGNKDINKDFFEVEDCAQIGYPGVEYNANLGFVHSLLSLFGTGAIPGYPAAQGHCNKRSLTPLGEVLIREMMQRNMIIDVDHMGAKTLNAVLNIAEAEDYPVVRGHTSFLGQTLGGARSESSPAFVDRIRKVGGLVSPILHQGKVAGRKAHGPVAHDCDESSKTWAQTYQYAVDRMNGGAVPLGSDMNGWVHQPAPRFGPDACAKNEAQGRLQANPVVYPFNAHGVPGTFGKMTTGDRVFDYNTDGFANIGLLPDFIQDLKNVGLSDADLKPLFSSAEAYVAMWEKAEGYTRIPLSANVPSMNWQEAQHYCTAQNLRLATLSDICAGDDGRTPKYGQPKGDVWMAVGDHPNAWISIGTSYPERRCRLHEELGGPPAWGLDKGPEPHTRQPTALRCVGYTRIPIGKEVSQVNWNDARDYCADEGRRLATQAEVCPGGAGSMPKHGQPEGDVWMAVGDHPNAWISIGTSYPERRCRLHEELGGPPTWGTDKGPEPVTHQSAALLCAPK